MWSMGADQLISKTERVRQIHVIDLWDTDKSLLFANIYLSVFAKTFPAGLHLGSGTAQIQAYIAGNSEPRGGLCQGWVEWMAQSMGYLLMACWALSKAGGRGGCLEQTWPFKWQIVLLLPVLVQLFELAQMFCVDTAPCWRHPCHMHVLGGILPARGVVRSLLATRTVLESTVGMFLQIRSDIWNQIQFNFCFISWPPSCFHVV